GNGAAVTANIASLVNSETSGRGVGLAFGMVRALGFLACLIVVGGLVYTRLQWPHGAQRADASRLLFIVALVGLAATALSVPLQAAYSSGGASKLLDATALHAVISARFGQAAMARFVLLLGLTLLIWRRARVGAAVNAAIALGGLTLFATFAYSGHGDTGRWPTLGFLTDVAHLGAAAVWLGGLVVLLVVIRSRRADREVGDGAAAFSKLALPAIAVLILSGVVQGFRQISSWEGLWHTSYARLLLAKVLVVLAIMVIASGARNAVRSRMTHPDGDAAMLRELRHGVAVEAAL